MQMKTIDGIQYARMLTGGAAELAENKERLNALNVFPVADGDTGTNMLRTMEGGLSDLDGHTEESLGAVSGRFARGVLLSARGNSGVILSQIFAGINEELAVHECADAVQLARAYRRGVAKSYASVQNPTEGTILTVFRESTEYVESHLSPEASVEDFYRLHIEEARRSLAATKEKLSVLAEADVVDSGAAGYLAIAEGMYRALCGESLPYEVTASHAQERVDIDRFTRDSVLEFGYCTEVLLRLTTAKVDPDAFAIDTVIATLQELEGESVVAYKQEDIVKVHVHTHTPGEVLLRLQAFGEFLTVKIENMSLGHSDTEQAEPKKPAKPKKKFSVVAVASGEGLQSLFSQMGADEIVSGGQTANPSIEELIAAFRRCEGEHILVLPNNKNVILAARQAAELYTDAKVHVLNTASLVEGYAALAVVTLGMTDVDAVIRSAERAAKAVVDGEITRAVRDANVDGRVIRCGDYMAFSAGKILAVAEDREAAVEALLNAVDTDLCEIITLFVGKDVPAECAEALAERLGETYDECEILLKDGGQETYDYLVAVE